MKTTSRTRSAGQLVASVLLATGALGLLLRFTVKDGVAGLAMFFYALAPLVLVVVFAASCGLYLWSRRPRYALAAFAATIVALVVWLGTDYVRAPRVAPQGDHIRVVLWNISRPGKSEQAFIPALQATDAQILLLVESGGNTAARRRFWESHFPGYHVYLSPAGVTLLSTYPASSVTMHQLDWRARIGVYDLETPVGTVSVVGVDIESSPLVSRKPSIDRVYEIATSKSHPVIVLGDFNTPHTSVLFSDFRRSFQHAFERSGRGLITTWMAFFPLLALDHIWVSGHFVPLQAQVRRTPYSDHALVVADVRLKEADAAPEGALNQ